MKQKVLLCCIGVLLLLGGTTGVAAQDDALMTLLKSLRDNGTIDTATYEMVKSVAESESRSTQEPTGRRTEIEEVTSRMVDKKLEQVRTEIAKSRPALKVGGRIQLDAATYREDQVRHNDGTEIRRARLFAQGELGENWGYKLQYDFVNTGIDGIQDAYLDYKGLKLFDVRLGHFKEPFSLQNMTSSKYITFTERGLPHLFAEGRNIGIQAKTGGRNWSAAAGAFGKGRDKADGDNEGWGLSARGSYAPLFEEGRILHLGASVSYRKTGSAKSLRWRERPESHVTDIRIVDTGSFDADDYTRLVLESAFILGPFSLQGEYYHTMVNRDIAANPDLDFNGFYVEGGWFLTGESPNYKGSSGSFSRVTPRSVVGQGGWGAWQLAVRFSSLDLIDGDIDGGEADSFSAGVNWFATSHIRFTANYVNVLDVKGGPNPGDEPDAFQIRAQLEF